jgi:myosin heavy subunit
LAFWIANLSQLLYYLKKDAGLVVATAEHQLAISELISETYTLLVTDSEKRMDRILEPAMLEFEQIDGLEAVSFADDWHRFFRRGRTSTSSPSSPNRRSFNSTPQDLIRTSFSPQSITSLLTSILYVLQSYDVHPVIVIQAMAQLFHFLSCEAFNRILTNKKYLCRSKALQIRMNLTVIEEWVREHHLPNNLNAYFNPVVQLVQLLQCVSQLTDLMDFISTVKSFDLLNPMQVKRLILNYRYEVNEPRLPEEIEKYTMQIAEDTLKSIQQCEGKSSIESFRNSRPNSISSLGSLLYSMSQKRPNNRNNRLSIQSPIEDEDISEEDNGNWLVEKRDSKYMLPFSLPTTTNMVHSGWHHSQPLIKEPGTTTISDTIYLELKQKMAAEREKHVRESSVIPSIPEEWLGRLDHHNV